LNRQVFLDGCLRRHFSFVEDVLNVEADVLLAGLEQLRHVALGEPGGLAFHTDLQAGAPVFGLVEEEFAWIA
jgi:hypothetical protein